MTPNQLSEALRKDLSALYECIEAPQEGVQVHTPLVHPDGGIVDVFVLERDGRILVTDYGEALGWLLMQSTSGKLSPKQRWMVDDVCQTLGIEFDGGQLQLWCQDPLALPDAIERVAQASLRISDIWFTFRTRNIASVADEVDEWLAEHAFQYDRDVKRSGKSGREWTVDYQVATPRVAWVFLLSSGSRPAARTITHRVVAGCYDMHDLSKTEQASFISVFDDTVDVWQQEDFALVEQVSQTVMWSRPDDLEQALTLV